MKAKPLKRLNRAEVELIIDSMRFYLRELFYLNEEGKRRQLELDYIKVLKHREKVELDGQGMKHISRALRHKGYTLHKKYGSQIKRVERKIMYNLAISIDMKRIAFQKTYGPKVKKNTPTVSPVDAEAQKRAIVI
ncbi:hypothetical protein [Bacillus sp. FJAT-45350]|uniref:hypothetical protein n=1 Tax=Bacillus sp. FJAT-45350 TaxID=2011014 RepID=UPI000BB8FE0E|nr:hypothetical protein [Bacillus sp. FJAT-45350]